LPYLIGRLYFSDLHGLRDLAIGVFIGGLIYVPLCLFEIRMSPQLHRLVYGFHGTWGQNFRFGGYRPTVFMQHGLMVGMWMTAASLIGVWLWFSGSLKRLWSVPLGWLVPPLVITTVLVKSFGALALLVAGVAVLLSGKFSKSALPVLCLALVPVLYVPTRASGHWSGSEVVEAAAVVANDERSRSLGARMDYENILAKKALQRPVLGWGGWGRNRVYDERGKDISITDGFWIIALGVNGFVGLISIYGAFLLPVFLLILRLPRAIWGRGIYGPLSVLSVLLVLYMIDCITNGMINPIFTLICGGVSGVAALAWQLNPARQAARTRATDEPPPRNSQ